ncbi:hypothetical protein R1sor_018609 [Riccia sorocarpa]|uniref:Uncharacterized protein n=1 Tax=Riccia sorocarpa TaxID=122646 RepID=A0ABD3IEA9_9MARC
MFQFLLRGILVLVGKEEKQTNNNMGLGHGTGWKQSIRQRSSSSDSVALVVVADAVSISTAEYAAIVHPIVAAEFSEKPTDLGKFTRLFAA